MKALLVLSVLLPVSVHAADAEPKFAEQKKRVLEHITAQMGTLENTKKCVEAAADQESIKKCHESAKAERMKFEAERKKERGQQIDDQIKKLEEKKKSLEEKKK